MLDAQVQTERSRSWRDLPSSLSHRSYAIKKKKELRKLFIKYSGGQGHGEFLRLCGSRPVDGGKVLRREPGSSYDAFSFRLQDYICMNCTAVWWVQGSPCALISDCLRVYLFLKLHPPLVPFTFRRLSETEMFSPVSSDEGRNHGSRKESAIPDARPPTAAWQTAPSVLVF